MIYFFATGIVEGGNGYRYNLIQDMEGGDGRAERKYCNKQGTCGTQGGKLAEELALHV